MIKKTLFVILCLIVLIGYSQVKKIDSLDQVLKNSQNTTERINTIKDIVLESYLKDLKKIKEVSIIAKNIGNEKKHHSQLLLIRRVLGVSLMNNGEFNLAKKEFFTNINSLKLPNEANQAYVDYMNLSNLYRYKVELDSCELFMKKAIDLVENIPMKDKYTSAYNNYAGLFQLKGQTDKAISYYLKGIDSSKYLKFERKIISTYNNLAQLFRESGDCEKSIFYAKQGLAIGKRLDFKQGMADASLHLGYCYSETNKSKDSIEYFYNYSMDTYKALNDNIYLLEAYENYGAYLSKNKNIDASINLKKTALTLAEKIDMKDKVFAINVSLGRDFFKQKKYNNSLKHINKAIQDTLKVNLIDYDNLVDLYYQKAKIEQLLDNKNTALEYSYKYANALQKNYDILNKKNVNDIETKYQTEKKEKENLQLKADKAQQAELLATKSKQTWQLGAGLATSIIGLGIFTFYYRKNKRQKETIENLQKELHHRVKNNLSVIDTFIEVAKDEFNDPKIDVKLNELQNRIDSINEVHQQLYTNKDVTNLNLKKYIEKLANNVSSTFSDQNITIEKDVQDHFKLQADKSFPVGLIINEFLTNSYKYAFKNKEGSIKIRLNDLGNSYQLSLSDNGKGLPDNFDIDQTNSFGLRITKLLAQQLNGTFDLSSTEGVQLTINFPKS